MMSNLVLLLIATPVVFSILFLLSSNKSYYKLLSTLMVAIGTVLSVYMVTLAPAKFEIAGSLAHTLESLVLVCEAVILLVMFGFAIKHKKWFAFLLILITTGLTVYSVKFVPASENIYFNVDKLSFVMALIVNIVGTLILLFSNEYLPHYEEHRHMKSRQRLYYFIVCIFLGAMNGLVFSDSLSWVYFFWEITTLSSFILISYNQDEEAINNGFLALMLNLIGGISFSIGIILFKKILDIDTLSALLAKGPVSGAFVIPVFLLCIAGFAKSAQVPFQKWLLGAMVAPTPVSALLHSSTMVKAGVFLVVKLAPAYAGTFLGLIVAIYGAVSFLACSAIAISQRNAKRVLAYSTIANLGLIIMSAGVGTDIAVSAAILLIIFHAISKALLFLCTGQIEHSIGSRDIEDMAGLVKRYPSLAILTGIGMASMLLPPFGVLITKWLAIEAASYNPILAILLVLGSAVTTVFWLKWFGTIFAKPVDTLKSTERMDWTTSWPLGILAALAILTSVFINQIFNKFVLPEVSLLLNLKSVTLVGQTDISHAGWHFSSLIGSFDIASVFIAIILGLLLYLIIRPMLRPTKISNIYMCGENNLASDQESFRNGLGAYEKASVGNLYAYNLFDETKITWIGYIVSIATMIIVFVGGGSL